MYEDFYNDNNKKCMNKINESKNLHDMNLKLALAVSIGLLGFCSPPCCSPPLYFSVR